MFEFTVARKYLIPRWRQLSVSIISMISILVIALVVWLLVVFFSVTHGLERGWIQKLTALTAPVRVTPTQEYYNSYYYLIDSVSSGSNFSHKTIGEKIRSVLTNPYNPEVDEETPLYWPAPVLNADGSIKDLTKEAYAAIEAVPGIQAHDYEVTASNLRLRLLRQSGGGVSQAFLTQATYLGSIDPSNHAITKTVLTTTTDDLENLFHMLAIGSDNIQEDFADTFAYLTPKTMQQKLATFFEYVDVKQLRTPQQGWRIPKTHLPKTGTLSAIAVYHNNEIIQYVIPKTQAEVSIVEDKLIQEGRNAKAVQLNLANLDTVIPLFVEGGIAMNATIQKDSVGSALRPGEVAFEVDYKLQGQKLQGITPIGALHFETVSIKPQVDNLSPLWLHNLTLTQDPDFGDGVLLPKAFRETGVRLGDRGYLSFYTPTASTVQEQRLPVYIAGFYDPGIIPIGGKFVLANEQLTTLIRSSHQQEEVTMTNGINVRIPDLEKAEQIKKAIQQNLKDRGIAEFWNVETYREYDFTKPLLDQLQSDKMLLTIISLIIILVACSNIISMLIILVNDKKIEIGILRSMGATSRSIATIFGFCGMIMGMIGSLIGTIAAIITLKNIDVVVKLLSKIQGHAAFNPLFYGESLPNQLSYESLIFVILVTAGISLLAGLVPAVKASMLRPSAILRSE